MVVVMLEGMFVRIGVERLRVEMGLFNGVESLEKCVKGLHLEDPNCS